MRSPRRTASQRSVLTHDLHTFGLNIDTREVILQSNPEGAEDGLDSVAANTFIKNLLLLNSFNHQPILVHSCTCGGDWNYGMAIFDAISASPSPVVLLAYAHARSMSSIIPQAAKKRVLMPNADFLIHFGTQGFDGDSQSFVAEGEKAKELNRRMIDIYSVRCARGPFFRRRKMSREKVRQYLREQMNTRREWYMSPDEAVDMGFMDGVFGKPGYRTFEEIRGC